MSGPDGDKYMFCGQCYPEDTSHAGVGDTEIEAAFNFLKELYGVDV
jgi:hypothetical protein